MGDDVKTCSQHFSKRTNNSKDKTRNTNHQKIKQTFKFNVCLEYNVHLENVSPSEGCEIWEIIGESFQVKKK